MATIGELAAEVEATAGFRHSTFTIYAQALRPFQIFCLGLMSGLRKREIDTLLWRQVDLSSNQIRIEPMPSYNHLAMLHHVL